MGAGVFVSYRRDDDPGSAGRVRDALAQHFGDEAVFFDRDSIRGGERWEQALDEALDASSALVLVVGPRWVACLAERLARTEPDYHLREITTALDRGLTVYPVRVQGASMPDLDALPDVLRDRLPALQWTAIHDDLFRPSMDRVAADLARIAGVVPASSAAADAAVDEILVGPWDSDAAVHEVADAVAQVRAGGRVRVLPGRYLKPVVIDRPVSIVGAGSGEVLLDVDRSPAISCRAAGVVLRRISVRTTAEPGVGIEVLHGDLTAEAISVRAHRPAGSSAMVASGPGVRLVLIDGDLGGADVALAVTDGAEARVERTTAAAIAGPAIDAARGATVRLTSCSAAVAGAGVAVRAEDGGAVHLEDASLATAGGSSILVDGGSATVRSTLAPASPGAGGSVAGRVVRAVPGGRPAADDPGRGDWTVEVRGGGTGRFEGASLAVARLLGGGARFEGCTIATVAASGPALDELHGCELGQVTVGDGAAPSFHGCTLAPARGVKVTVDVGRGGRASFAGGEIGGRNVRDGSPDPAVRVVGGWVELRSVAVRNPGEGAIWAEDGGEVALVDADVRCTLNGPALVVRDGSITATGTEIGGGVRVEGGRLEITGGGLGADAVSGQLAVVRGDAALALVDAAVRGPGLARTRKVGRWIEARSEKVGSAAARLLGTSPVVCEAPATVRVERCTASGLDLDALGAIDGIRVVDCTVAAPVDR